MEDRRSFMKKALTGGVAAAGAGMIASESNAYVKNWEEYDSDWNIVSNNGEEVTNQHLEAPTDLPGPIKSKEWYSIPADSLTPSEAATGFAYWIMMYMSASESELKPEDLMNMTKNFIEANNLDEPRVNWGLRLKFTKPTKET